MKSLVEICRRGGILPDPVPNNKQKWRHMMEALCVWILVPHEIPQTDDRAYLLGYLTGIFNDVLVTRVDPAAAHVPAPARPPDLVLNLVGVKNRALLDDVAGKARKFGAPLSNPARAAWRSKDKRTYVEDFPEFIPPTRTARTMAEVDHLRQEFGGDIVIKDPFGGRGRGVERIRGDADMATAQALLTASPTDDLVVQPFHEGFSRGDKRVVVQRTPSGGFEIIAHLTRVPAEGGWKSNLLAGGRVRHDDLADDEAGFALEIARRAGLDNVALDIGAHDGRLYLIETNQTYGGLIDFDIGRGARSVSRVGDFLRHLAINGRA